jgi:hypothetical protein
MQDPIVILSNLNQPNNGKVFIYIGLLQIFKNCVRLPRQTFNRANSEWPKQGTIKL